MADEQQVPEAVPVGVTDDNLADTLTRLEGLYEDRTAGGDATPPVQDATVAQPQAPATEDDWREKGFPSDHPFLTGKTPQDIANLVRAEAARAQRLDQQLRERPAAQAPAAATPATAAPPAETPGEDPRMAEVRDKWYSDQDAALKVWREIQRDDAREIFESHAQEERSREFGKQALVAANAGVKEIVRLYGVPEKVATVLMQSAVRHMAAHLERAHAEGRDDSAILTMPQNYLAAYEFEYGPPPAVAASATVPAAPSADPPGAKGSAPAAPRRAAQRSLSPDAERSISSLADAAGLGVESTKRLKDKFAH